MQKTLIGLNPRRILIRSTNWIGDAVMTTPAVRTIRENFPESEITILCHPWVADVFTASPHVDKVKHYQKKEEHGGLKGIWRLSRELASYRFDLAILLQNAFEAALIAMLARIPVRAGYNTDGRSLFLTHPVTLKKNVKKLHQVHYYQDMLQKLGLRPGPDELFLRMPDTVQKWAHAVKTSLGQGPVIGLNPGAAYGPAKRWPAEKYGALAKRLHHDLKATFLVFGTKADEEAAVTIQRYVPEHVKNLAGNTTLAEAMALIGECDAFVTNDSGLMHVGAALRTPLVAIFGSTDAVATGPFSDNSVVIRKDLDCSPCLKSDCKTDFRCMMDIQSNEVAEAVEKLLINKSRDK